MNRNGAWCGALRCSIPVLAVCLWTACGTPPVETGPVALDEPPPAEAVAQARETADALGREVVAALFRELEAGDPLKAMDACAVEAQRLSAEHSRDGLKVRRVSRQFRNPADEPDLYEYRRLGELEALHERGELPAESVQVVTQGGKKSLRYLKPILLKQPCLACHGPVEQIDDTVLDAIHARYPGDRAIGFEVDDLRGAISVSVPL